MERTKPSYDTKINGIRVAVWENETDGRRWFSAAPSRRYLEPGSKEPRYAATFNGVGDLLVLREAINRAISWMASRESEGEVD